MTVPTAAPCPSRCLRPRLCRSLGRGRRTADAHRQVPHPRPPRRRRDERGLPRLRRLPAPQRRDQAGARRRPPAIRSTATTPSASSPPRRRSSAGCSTPNVVQIFDAVPDPVAPYLVMEYVAGSTLRPVLPRRPAALARADRRDRLQVRDGARLRLPPGPDPSRRQAGEPARGADQRHDHRRQDQRLRQRPEPRLGRDADPSRRLARLHVARAARRRHASTAAPTSTRSAPCSTTSSPAGRSSMRRCSRP